MIKKFLLSFVMAITAITAVSTITNQPAQAANGFSGSCRTLLGLVSWDCNVNISDQNSLKSGIWTIVANVLTDLTIIAAYLIVGFVIYGGYQYIMSGGDPGKVANGKKTLTHAFIGLAIVISANAILASIRIALGADFTSKCITESANCYHQDNASNIVTSAIQWTIGIGGIVSAIFVVYGGISYITSAGDASKLQKAKQTILYALIGLAIVGLAEIITLTVTNIINDANKNASTKVIPAGLQPKDMVS